MGSSRKNRKNQHGHGGSSSSSKDPQQQATANTGEQPPPNEQSTNESKTQQPPSSSSSSSTRRRSSVRHGSKTGGKGYSNKESGGTAKAATLTTSSTSTATVGNNKDPNNSVHGNASTHSSSGASASTTSTKSDPSSTGAAAAAAAERKNKKQARDGCDASGGSGGVAAAASPSSSPPRKSRQKKEAADAAVEREDERSLRREKTGTGGGGGGGSTQDPNDRRQGGRDVEYYRTVQELEGVVFPVSWKEAVCVLFALALVSSCCLALAVAAEISVEIHCLDQSRAIGPGPGTGGGAAAYPWPFAPPPPSWRSVRDIAPWPSWLFSFLLPITASSSSPRRSSSSSTTGGPLSSMLSSSSSSSFLGSSTLPSPYPSYAALDARERDLNMHHRVTIVEPEFASIYYYHNYRYNYGTDQGAGGKAEQRRRSRRRARLQRVVHLSPTTGYPQPLIVVEEEDGYYIDDQGNYYSIGPTDSAYRNNGTQPQYHTTPVKQRRGRRVVKPPAMTEPKVLPKACKNDPGTIGFDNWATLHDAIQEANSMSVDRFVRWSRYFAETSDDDSRSIGIFDDDTLYYEQDVYFTICPGITLRARKGPIYVNAPNLVLGCSGCAVEMGGSHFSFGPQAKNVRIAGIAFRKATASSVVLFQSGAEVAFEDCSWTENAASAERLGAVADINSTSSVAFYRCQIGNTQNEHAPSAQSSLSVRA